MTLTIIFATFLYYTYMTDHADPRRYECNPGTCSCGTRPLSNPVLAPEERVWRPIHFCRTNIKKNVGTDFIYCFVSYFSPSDDFFCFGITKTEMTTGAKTAPRVPKLGCKRRSGATT